MHADFIPAWICVQTVPWWPTNTIKPLLEVISAVPAPSTKAVLAQFTVLAQCGSPCKATL